ncbi:MAG: fibronectin type III domain-containing protein [Candidatus Paceibacterota bacterium]
MKLQKAFFLVLGLAFLVSLGSLVSGTPGQKAQTITSVTSSNSRLSVDRLSNSDSLRNVGTNSILLTSPSVSTSVSPNQTLPMTCEITVESGFRVFDLVFAAYSPATGEVVFHHEDNVSFADGAYSVDVTIPSTASEYIVMNCVAEYWNPDSSQYRQIASNYPVNVTRTTQPPVSTAPTAPSNLSGSATGQTSANITWSDNSNNETSFTLQRATNTSFTAGLTTLSPSANATSQSITGLAAGTTYYFRIQANNGSLSSGWSNVATVTTTSTPTNDTTAPSRPGGMTSSNRTSYQIQVNWTPSTDNVAVAGYYLYRNNGGSTSVNNTTPIATLSPNETSYNDVGLQARKGYRYRVRAFDAAGNLSNWGLVGTSNTATTLTASTLAVTMPASSSVTVTNATSSSLQVNWSPSTSGEIFDYKVYANNGGSTAINTTTPVGIISTNPSNSSYCFQSNKFCFVHTGLNASTTYKYQVAASDPANNNSNKTSAKSGTTLAGGGTGPVAPTAPSNLSGSATGQTSANITWSDNSNNETSFTLQRATNTSFTAGLTTLSPSANATSQSITGLAAGTTYYFRIQANNGSLSSGWSNVATLVMPAVQNPPSAPTGVSVGSPTTSSLTVSWSAVADTTSYKVYRVLSSGIVDMAVPPVTVAVPNISTTIENLSSGTAYRFLVTANNAAGESTLTPTGSGASANNATGTTSSPQITVSSLSLVRTDGTVIESLDGGESINVGTQNGGVGVNISVKANTVPATAGSVVFTLQRPNSTVYNLTENQAPYTLFGDSGDTTIVAWQNLILGGYTLTVTPYAGANGTGQVGVPRTVQFQIVNNDDSTPPVNPTNVLVTYRSANQIKLGWTNSTSTDVASYRVHRDNVSVGVVNHPTNTFTDTTVNGTSNYAYKVISIDTSNNEATLPSTASNAPTLSTAFALNNQVETNTNAQVKSAPESSTVAGTQASGSIGTITNGPVWVVGGVQYWYVNFNSGTDGWVNETNLDIYTAPTTDTSAPTYPGSSSSNPLGNASFTVVPSPTNPQGALVLDWADATDLTPPVTYKVSRSTVSTGPFYQVGSSFHSKYIYRYRRRCSYSRRQLVTINL